jgi:hypothetical protein
MKNKYLISIICIAVLAIGISGIILYKEGHLTTLVQMISQVKSNSNEDANTPDVITIRQIPEISAPVESTPDASNQTLPVGDGASLTLPQIVQQQQQAQKQITGSEFGASNVNTSAYPIIASFTTDPDPSILLNVGDTLHLTVNATDPQNRQIEYLWWSYTAGGGNLNNVYNGWSTNNTITYTITDDDIKTSGEKFRVGVQIRATGETTYRTGSGENGYDDEIYTDYMFNAQ